MYKMRRIIIESVPTNMLQEGGLTKADLLSGNYITENNRDIPNVEIENGEFVKNSQDGSVKEAVGSKHIDGGIKVNLPNQSQILSDYTKIGANNAKIFGEMFDIKIKATDTFATVLDKYSSKIGIKKLEEEEKDIILKIEKNMKSSIERKTKQLNEEFLAEELSEINSKKEVLNKLKAQAFDTIFKEQEKIPKKGDGTQVLDKSGKPIKQEGGDVAQQQPSLSAEEIIQAYAQVSGEDPNIIMQQLQQLAPEEQQAAIQQMAASLQGGQPEMKEGGELEKYQGGSTTQEPQNFSFATQYTPVVPGYNVTGKPIVDQAILSDVERMQKFIPGKGYGQKMQDVEKTINTHSWYFDTEEKKQAFRDAAMSNIADKQKPVGEFQKAYNDELIKRAKEAGINQEGIDSLINELGFTGKDARQLDSKFGAFTSTRPLFEFIKPPVQEVPSPQVLPSEDTTSPVRRDITKNIIYEKGMPYIMPPSAPLAPYLQQVDLSRLEGQKGSVENQLQDSSNQLQTAIAATRGLPPAQAAAMMANFLSTSGQRDTAGIAAQEAQDLQNKARIEQYNASQADKEQILNEQLKKQYERESFGTLNVNEQNWRNYFTANDNNRKALSYEIERRNIMNLGLENYQLNGRGGFDFVNQSKFNAPAQATAEERAFYSSLTPDEKDVYIRAYGIDKSKALDVLNAYRAKKATQV